MADHRDMDDLSFPDNPRDGAARDGDDHQHDWQQDDWGDWDDWGEDGDGVQTDDDRSYVDHHLDHTYYDTVYDTVYDTDDHDIDDYATDGYGDDIDDTISTTRALGRSPDDPPLAITSSPGSLYAAYDRRARAAYDCCAPISPAEVILEMTGLRLGPFDRELLASLVCARIADGAISGIDPTYRALASRVVETHATTGATDALAYLLDASFVTLAGIEWASCAGLAIAAELPELCEVPLQPDLAELLEPLLDKATRTAVALRACYGGYRWPRSLSEAAIAGLGVMERAGLGLGKTSVASLLLLGTGATQADLPPSAFGCSPGDAAAQDAAQDAAEQRLAEWHEEQHASLVAELLDAGPGSGDPDSDSDLVLHRIGLLGLVLGHRPARRADLEALLGSLIWLFDLHVVPALSCISRRDAARDRVHREHDPAHRDSAEPDDLGEEDLDSDEDGDGRSDEHGNDAGDRC